MRLKIYNFIILFGFLVSCASSQDIFPAVVTTLTEGTVILPNPVSVVADSARSQIIVANSNVDIFFDQGSMAVLNVDATNANSPVLSASQIIPAPNFAGQIYMDGTSSTIYVPFREASSTNQTVDQIISYNVSTGSLSTNTQTTISANPFGVTGDASRIYAVSDDVLTLFDTGLNAVASVDLEAAEVAGITDTDSSNVDFVAINSDSSLAVISNANGKLFIVNLSSGNVAYAVSGPEITRNIIIDSSNLLYALDPGSSIVWVFDLDLLAAAGSSPVSVDDSAFLIATIPVGSNPNGMALDTANHRLYVGNSAENSVSVIDTLTYQEITRISVASEDLTAFNRGADFPFGLGLGTFNGTVFLFVTGYQDNSVAMINTDTLKVVEVFPDNTL